MDSDSSQRLPEGSKTITIRGVGANHLWDVVGGFHVKKLGPPAKVPISMVMNNPGFYRRCGMYFEYWPADEYWFCISKGMRTKRECSKRYSFVRFPPSSLRYGIACMVANWPERIHYPDRVKLNPGATHVLYHLDDLTLRTFVDRIEKELLSWEHGYPKGNLDAIDSIYTDLVEELPVGETVDEQLYQLFEENLLRSLVGGPLNRSYRHDKTRKLGAATFHDLLETLLFRSKEFHTPEDWDQVRNTPLCLATGVLPKVGQVTSSGGVRRIFPMSLGLSCALAELMGDANSRLRLPGVTIIKGAKFPPHRYTYDVTSCDRVVYDYVYRFTAERPTLRKLLLPPVFTEFGVRYVRQFQSGLLCTTLVVQCFTAAILQSLGVPGCIQGDGIMTTVPIEHPLLRKCPDYTINGFCYRDPNHVRYVNGRTKLLSPRLTRGGINKHKWDLRRQIYIRFLNADPFDLPPATNERYDMLTNREVLEKSMKLSLCRRLLKYVYGYDSNLSNWEAAPTTVVDQPHETSIALHKPRLLAEAAKLELV